MKTQTNRVNKILGPVGFIGLGQMGGGIVRNLLSKNLSIVAFDSDEEVVNKLKGSRIEVAKNPSEVAKKVSILLSTEEKNKIFFINNPITNANNDPNTKNLMFIFFIRNIYSL